MWNIIKLDGEYYHIDVTSDDPTPDDGSRLIYSNFNLTDAQISEKHTWDTSQFPNVQLQNIITMTTTVL